MNQKQIGIVLIIFAVMLVIILFLFKSQLDFSSHQAMAENGTCFTEDGVCLHQRATVYLAVGFSLSAIIFILGIYLIFFDSTQKKLAEQQLTVAKALKLAGARVSEKTKFDSFLAGFTDDEQNVLKAIHSQDGIKQSTLRFKTGISKTSLSLILKDLEKRDFVSRKPSGKAKEVYLRKKF